MIALCTVIFLILAFAFILKKFKLPGFAGSRTSSLAIEDVLYLDTKRKLIIVKYLKKKYVLLIGNGETVIDVINIGREEGD